MNSLPPLPLIDNCLFIDNSGWVEGMSTCYRYLQYRSLNLRISSGESAALNFGSSQHLAREYRHAAYGTSPIDDFYYDNLGVLFTDFFQRHPIPNDDWRNLNWAMTLTRKYMEKYNIEEFSLLEYTSPIPCPSCEGTGELTLLDSFSQETKHECYFCSGTKTRTRMVELPFALPLYQHKDITIMYSGRIDLPLSIQSQIFVEDHKHVSSLGERFFDEMRMSAQLKGYCWAFEETTGKKVTGYIANGVRTKEVPLYVQQGKTYSRGGKSYTADKWWEETFQREKFLLKPGEIGEWKNNVIDLCEEFFWHYERGFMPMKTKWCAIYGKCPYYEVCRMAQEDRETMLRSGAFTKNVWSPLNKK